MGQSQTSEQNINHEILKSISWDYDDPKTELQQTAGKGGKHLMTVRTDEWK